MSDHGDTWDLRETGRVLEQDPKSLDWLAPVKPVKTIRWDHYGPVFDQGSTRTCCSQSITQAMMCDPLITVKRSGLTEKQALKLHARTTRLDDDPGNEWPEHNAGSSILAAGKAAVEAGWIAEYRWAKGLDHLKGSIQFGPLVLGTPWFTGMKEPSRQGVVRATGDIEFWHAWVAVGYDRRYRRTIGLNSWGSGWAAKGFFYVPDKDMRILLDGEFKSDAMLPIRSGTMGL